MTFLAPWWLAASAAMTAVVVVLHLLSRRRPRALPFPTARFVPDRPATAASLAARPTDLPLLLLRVLLVFLLGAAFAQPVVSPARRTVQVVLVDSSRLAPPLDSANAELVRSADLAIPFDGSLSAGLVAALRAAPGLIGRGDSLALTIISPFAAEAFDAASLRIREQWKGGITLVPGPATLPSMTQRPIVLSPDDPLSATLGLLDSAARSSVRLVRESPTPEDTALASAGGTLVLWPRVLSSMKWPRGPEDSVGGVAVGDQAVVAAFGRNYAPPEGAPSAVWADGRPAATQVSLGKGCVRHVAIALPEAGDLVLRENFLRLSRELLSPCNGWIRSERIAASLLDSLRGGPSLLPAVSVSGGSLRKTPANPWLLLGSALLFALEPLIRRRRAGQ